MLNWINKKRNQKGFTLVELVVVIAILGILAALAIPRLGSTKKTAEEKAVVANARSIASAVMMIQAAGTGNEQPGSGDSGVAGDNAFEPYLNNYTSFTGYKVVYHATNTGEIVSITVPTTNSKTKWVVGANTLSN